MAGDKKIKLSTPNLSRKSMRGGRPLKIIENRSILATGDDSNQNCFLHTDITVLTIFLHTDYYSCFLHTITVLYHFMSTAAEEKSMSL